ncbi:hypothetical protein MN116_008573, partial [Schistosoma mekongi]
ICEPIQPTNQAHSNGTFYITPPPYFTTAEHLTIPSSWSSLNQKKISEACSKPLKLHNVPTLLDSSPIINTITTLTPVFVSGVIPSCLPQQNQSLSNPNRSQNPSINTFVNNHRRPPTENTTALSSGVFLGDAITPPIIQSFGSNISSVYNGISVYHRLLHDNHSSAQSTSSASSTRAVHSSAYLPLNIPIQPQQLMNNTRYCPTVSSTNDLNRVISNSFNVSDSINRNNNNINNDINSLSIVHSHLGNSCINHLSLNKDCNPIEQVCSSFESHQKSLNQFIHRSNSSEPVNINQIITTKSAELQTHSSTIGVSAIDKQTFTTYVSSSNFSARIANSIAPDVTATSNDDSSMENSAFDGVLWGRLCRRADGDLMFPGLSQTCTFRGANSMLKQIFQMTRTENSLPLQLPVSALRNEIDPDLRLENHPSASLLNPASKKGFHICLCCRLTFTSSNLYESHLNRLLAHIHYRCHLCFESNVIPQATTNQSQSDMNLIPSATNSVEAIRRNPIDRNISITNSSNGDVIHFQFYSVLPGGIIKATNHCAIFSHFTSAHPNQMNLWKLEPSLLTIYPFKKSLTCSDLAKSSLSDLLSNIQSEKPSTSLVPNRSDEFESGYEFLNNSCSSAIFNDLRQSLNNVSALDDFDLLHSSSLLSKSVNNVVDDNALSNSSINSDDYHNDVIIEEFSSLQRIFTPSPNSSQQQKIILTNKGATHHHRRHHHQVYPHPPRLPSPDSLLFRVILNLANSEIWHSHLFLSNWCDNNSSNARPFSKNANKPKNVEKNNSANIVINIDDDDDEDDVDNNGLVKLNSVIRNDDNLYNTTSTTTTTNVNNSNSGTNNNMGKNVDDFSISQNKPPAKQSSQKKLCNICLPPSAPSNAYLNQALECLRISSNRHNHDHNRLTSVSYTMNTTNPTSDTLSIDNGKQKSKKLNENRQSGVLCCLICKFRTNDCQLLVDHLIGNPPLIQTKCGLCGQLLHVNEPLLCSVKAHLLIHLGCFLMCPRCGFTPPLYLAPDCAQLCLRVHLRFVCYHFNLKEVYQCNYCEGHGKGFLNYENLCQHHLEHHVKRIYSCLWCARQVNNSNSNNNDNTNCASNQLNDHSNNNTIISINNFVATVDQISKKNSSYTIQHHIPTVHHMNKENIKLPFSTVSSQTQSRPNSSKSNSSVDSGDSSLYNKNQSIFRSTSIQEISHHLKSVHWPSVFPPSPVIEQVNNNEIIEQQPMCSITKTVGAIHTPLPSLPTVTVNHKPVSTISDDCDDSIALLKSNSNLNNLFIDSDVSQVTELHNNPLPPHHPHYRKRNMQSISANLVPHVDYSIVFQCIECLKEMNTKENYVEHFQTEHGTKHIREYFYRCFGSCKRLLPNIDVFREHLTNCLHAQSIYYATFGHLYNKDKTFDLFNINSSLNVTTMQDKQLTINSEQQSTLDGHLIHSEDLQNIDKHNTNSSPGCRLCFCAYCGIGSQRKSRVNYSSFPVLSSISPKSDLVLGDSCASDDGNSLPDVNNNLVSQNSINNPPNISVNYSLQSQNSVQSNSVTCHLSEEICPDTITQVTTSMGNMFSKRTTTMMTTATTTTTTSTTNRDNLYTPQYFTNLITLQIHEKSCHYSKSTNSIACPWCRKYISFSKKDKVNITYLHLFSHLREHCMASWYFERMRRWNKNAKGLPHCVCGLALLDSPLAIFSHAAAHLLHANRSSIIPDSSSHCRPHQQHSSSSMKSQSNSLEEFLLPKYNDHIPCSVEVYRHLRFSVFGELDAHLFEASHHNSYFTCPVCKNKLTTRWALTQHAFSEHWGTLCYICCVYIFKPARGVNSSLEKRIIHNVNTTDVHTVLMSSTSSCSSSLPSTPALNVVDPAGYDNMSKLDPPTLWGHIFHCMNKRHELLTRHRASLSSSSAGLSSLTTCSRSNAECPPLIEIHSDYENENNVFTDLQQLHNLFSDVIVIDSSPQCDKHGESISSQETDCRDSAVGNFSLLTCTTTNTITTTTSDNTATLASDYTVTTNNISNSTCLSTVTSSVAHMSSFENSSDYVHKIFNKKSLKHKLNSHRKHHVLQDNYDRQDNDNECVGYTTDNSITVSESNMADNRIDNHHSMNNSELVIESKSLRLDTTPPTDIDNTEMVCVLCGEKQTTDTWEEHCLSHRNPKFVWNGVQISQPNRPVSIEPKRSTVYRCYICYRRFTSRSSCYRHMTTVHRLKKTQIDSDLLTDLSSAGLNVPDSQSKIPSLSLSISNNSNDNSHVSMIKTTIPPTSSTLCAVNNRMPIVDHEGELDNSSTDLSLSNECIEQKRQSSTRSGHIRSGNSKYCCSICQISFISSQSLFRHRISAHGQKTK